MLPSDCSAVAVFQVALTRAPYRRQLHPYTVLAPRKEPHLQRIIALEDEGYEPVPQPRCPSLPPAAWPRHTSCCFAPLSIQWVSSASGSASAAGHSPIGLMRRPTRTWRSGAPKPCSSWRTRPRPHRPVQAVRHSREKPCPACGRARLVNSFTISLQRLVAPSCRPALSRHDALFTYNMVCLRKYLHMLVFILQR